MEDDLAAWIEGDFKYIVSSAGDVEIYDPSGDPGELENLAMRPEFDAQVERARGIADAWWSAYPARESAELPELDESELKLLEALGYVR
jgi:hypothetical protein